MINKTRVKRNFSRYSQLYDRYAHIQKKCAQDLMLTISIPDATAILDIGCGTGLLTSHLGKRFPFAQITGFDLSPKMLTQAREKCVGTRFDFFSGDADEVSFVQKFDLITSNASFQWFNDIEKSIFRFLNFLNKEGSLFFSVFGNQTFCELHQALQSVLNEDVTLHATAFLATSDLEKMMATHASNTKIMVRNYTETYSSLRHLLEVIKYTGIRGEGVSKNFLWTNSLLQKIENVYRDLFGQITVTYEVFFCCVEQKGRQ